MASDWAEEKALELSTVAGLDRGYCPSRRQVAQALREARAEGMREAARIVEHHTCKHCYDADDCRWAFIDAIKAASGESNAG